MIDTAYKDIGAQLRELRNEKGLTQSQVARRLRISQNRVCLWEAGKQKIRFSEALAYAAALGIESQRLYDATSRYLIYRGWLRPDGVPLSGLSPATDELDRCSARLPA